MHSLGLAAWGTARLMLTHSTALPLPCRRLSAVRWHLPEPVDGSRHDGRELGGGGFQQPAAAGDAGAHGSGEQQRDAAVEPQPSVGLTGSLQAYCYLFMILSICWEENVPA